MALGYLVMRYKGIRQASFGQTLSRKQFLNLGNWCLRETSIFRVLSMFLIGKHEINFITFCLHLSRSLLTPPPIYATYEKIRENTFPQKLCVLNG